MARAFGPSTLDNLPHASATHPGQTTRWGTTHAARLRATRRRENMPRADGPCTREGMPHAFGHVNGKHATCLWVTRQRKHAARLPVTRWEVHATCLRTTRRGEYTTRFRPMRPGQLTYTSGPLVRGKTWHAYSGQAPWKPYDTLWGHALRKQHSARVWVTRTGKQTTSLLATWPRKTYRTPLGHALG